MIDSATFPYKTALLEDNVKGERKKFFKKLLTYFLCDNIWSIFWRKHDFYLFHYTAIFKDRVKIKDVIIVKKYVFFNFVEKYVKKKKV